MLFHASVTFVLKITERFLQGVVVRIGQGVGGEIRAQQLGGKSQRDGEGGASRTHTADHTFNSKAVGEEKMNSPNPKVPPSLATSSVRHAL